jgi:virginiamycin B lyase
LEGATGRTTGSRLSLPSSILRIKEESMATALASGQTVTEFPVPTPGAFPWGITTGPDGNVWFTEEIGNRLGRVNSDGSITEVPVPTLGAGPHGITTGPDGNLWFTEEIGNRLGRVNSDESITEFPVPTPGAGPFGITTGPDGNLWFTEETGNKLGRLIPPGTTLTPRRNP